MNAVFQILTRLAVAASKRSEVAGAIIVIGIVFMFITPLPTGLVDVLIAVNICVSCLLIMLAMQLPKPLAFSTFPAVLLLTTMFRLALSIATTRLILLEQDAGHIVEAFGNFVVGGNLAVGMVIFLILTVVNFLVITKGSERVAEVGARFTLDAMPGKQMSIDSDLRAGLINVDQARQRRADLGKESQLFGAMDGAMKFVNGDAIAGLIIVAINLIGGIAIGVVQRGMAAGDAMQLYSVLTIGDGLIAQIPALLISITAGMIITRVPNEESDVNANIGGDIAKQLGAQPKSLIIAAIAMLGFAALPGMPTAVFIVISVLVGTLGVVLQRRRNPKAAAAVAAVPPEQNGERDIREFFPSRIFLLQFHPSQDQPEIMALVSQVRQRRNQLVAQFGITLPSFDIEYTQQLEPDEFRFLVYEVPVLRATFTQELVAVERQLLRADPIHSQAGRAARDESDLLWVPANDPMLQAEGIPVNGSTSLIVDRMFHTMQACGPQFIGLQESKSILSWLEREQPELAQEVQRVLPLSRFSAVLQRLASECVPLRAIRLIAESLVEHGQHEREVGALTDYVRIALKSLIYNQYCGPEGLQVWLLSPESENLMRDSQRQTQSETFFALPAEASSLLVEQLRQAFPRRTQAPSVLLVAQDLRSPLRTLLQEEFHHIPVLSFAELNSTAQVKVLGRLDLDEQLNILADESAA
jgi:type III secretion protein V